MDRHRDDISLELKALGDFPSESILITAAELGPADAGELPKEKLIPEMVDVWRRLTGMPADGIYAPELGQEIILVDTAVAMGLPLVDFDSVGGRAVPLVDINSFTVAGLDHSFSPLVLATDKNEIITIETPVSLPRAESILRNMTALSDSRIVYFFGAPVRVGDIAGSGIENNSLSTAMKLGSARNIEDIKQVLDLSVLAGGKVIESREVEREGFNCCIARFKSVSDQEILTLYILNEVLFVRNGKGELVAEAPDKILLIDPHSFSGLSSESLLCGHDVLLCVARADPLWQTGKARELFSSSRFDFFLDQNDIF